MRTSLDRKDTTQLDLLSIFHNLVAALWVVVALFPTIYLGTGVEIVEGRFAGVEDLTTSFGWTVILWATASVVLSLVMAALTFIAGWRLSQRRARSFCMTVAAINCFFFPFGTVVGIVTILVLNRPAVREAFGIKPRIANVAAWEDRTLP